MKNISKTISFSAVIGSSVHNMKNSLGMLLGTVDEVICSNTEDEALQKKLAHLKYEGFRLNNNLVQMLAIYRINNTEVDLHIHEYSMKDFLDECVLLNEDLVAYKGIRIRVSCPEEMVVSFDREMMSVVINSAINNAYKYTKDLIVLSAIKDQDAFVISVEDNGPGFPEETPYKHANILSPKNIENNDMGLGLYFASIIAKGHEKNGDNGFISCTNHGIEGGAKFSVHLS